MPRLTGPFRRARAWGPACAGAVLLFWGGVAAADVLLAPVEADTARYACDGGARLTVVYHRVNGQALALVRLEGRSETLATAAAASGLRFEPFAGGAGLVWVTREGSGTLTRRDAGGAEVPVLTGCAEVH